MKIAFLGKQLAGRRSGAAISMLELGALLQARGHDVRFAALKGDAVSCLGQQIRTGTAWVVRLASWADRIVMRDEQNINAVIRLTSGGSRVVLIVHSLAGSPQVLGLDSRKVRSVIWVADHVAERATNRWGPWPGPNFVIEGLPIIADRYKVERRVGGKIVQVNLSAQKGGATFWALVDRMMHRAFLGVRGWGEQVEGDPRPNVQVIGFQQDPRTVYQQAGVMILPSTPAGAATRGKWVNWEEAFPRVPFEAGLSGIPTIATRLPATEASIGQAGRFVPYADLDGWVEELARLDDPIEYNQASQEASDRSHEFAGRTPAIMKQYEEIICGS